ncbi:MAG: polysaccharide biosynthesis protein [Clostridiales bacterium]|nr:polysaccharide biosynthesis protein [Clostridiales bacterium]
MSIGRTKRSLLNIGVSIANRMLVTLLPFAIRSIMIYTIGIEYLGLDSLFTSILSMLSLSELGFSSAIVYSMYAPIATGDDDKVRGLLTFYKHVYRIVGISILAVGLIILPNIKWFIAEGTTYPSDVNIYFVYLVFLVNTSLSYLLYSYKSSVLIAAMRNDLDSIIETVRSVLAHALQIVVLLLFKQYYMYILVIPVITVLNNIARAIIIDKKFPQFKGNGTLTKDDKKEIMTRVGALIGNKLGGAVFTSVDSIVISKYLGVVVLAQYTNYFSIFSAVFAIETAAYGAFQSVVGNSLVANSKENNYALFKDLFFMNTILTFFCVCCFTSLYQPFIAIWVGNDNVLGIEIPLLLTLYFFVKSTRKTLFTFYEAAGMWRSDFLKPYVSVIVNLTVNILLVRIIGLPGVIISSILALALIEMPWESVVFFKQCFNKKPLEYARMIIKSVILCGACFGVTFFVSRFLPYGILGLVLRLITVLIVCSVLAVFMLFRTKEGRRVINRFPGIFKR